MKSEDFRMRQAAQTALEYDCRFDSRDIAVMVKDGIATLSGQVSSYAQIRAVQLVVQGIEGVRAVANALQVRNSDMSDTDIAHSVLQALAHDAVPEGGIKVAVQGGWVTFDGEVDNWMQRESAEREVTALRGVGGVQNLIKVRGHDRQAGATARHRGARQVIDRLTIDS